MAERSGPLARLMRANARAAQVVGMNRRNVELVYPNNPRRNYPLVDDKIVCKELLEAAGVPTAPTIAICSGLFAVDGLIESLRDRSDFVVKPANGSGGEGIVVLAGATEGGWLTTGGRLVETEALRQHLANCVFGAFSKTLEDRALVEERLRPHPVFGHLTDTGVSDVRLITLAGAPLMAMVRIPTLRSGGRANLHQGGVGVAVDVRTGRTHHALARRRPVVHHPDTGVPLIGIDIPGWNQVVAVARAAAAAVPLGYLGVDIIVDRDRGPLVIELNARPGLEIQNVNRAPLGPLAERSNP